MSAVLVACHVDAVTPGNMGSRQITWTRPVLSTASMLFLVLLPPEVVTALDRFTGSRHVVPSKKL